MPETTDTAERKNPAATPAPPPLRAPVPPSYVWGKQPHLPQQGVPDLAETAAKHIGEWVTGNGLAATEVKVTQKKQDVFAFDIPVSLQLTPTVIESRTPGQSKTGTQCASKAEMQTKIAALKTQKMADPKTVILAGEYLQKAPLLGWGGKQRFPLKEIGAEFSCAEQCPKCHGKKQTACGYCKGKGQTPCIECKGFGETDCRKCMALGEIPGPGPNGKMKCPECFGRKRAPCRECRGLKNIQCPKCRGAKFIGCTDCNKTGSICLHNSVAFEAFADMSLSTADMPAEIRDLLEATGGEAKLATELHAAISLVMPDSAAIDAHTPPPATAATAAATPAAQNTQQPELHYHVEIPYGSAEFSIGGKRYDAKIAGYQSCILSIGDFLDPQVKAGIAALQKIVKGPMATESLMKTALKLRLVKDVFSHTGDMTKKKLLNHIRTLYPRGLSDKYAKACVVFADQAIKSLTDKPRKIGAGVGSTIATALAGAWFFAGLRGMVLTPETPANEQMIYDFSLAGGLALLAYFTVRFFGANALKKIMSFQGTGAGKQALPPAGLSGLLAVTLVLIAFFSMALLMPQPPAWF